MNPSILNRDSKLPEDGWYQFEVPGEHVNERARVIQVIDAKAVDSIINRFTAEAKTQNFGGLLVDRDHFSLDDTKPTEALGWDLEMRNRAGIPEARIEWTAVGRPLVEGKVYKYFSSVYEPRDVERIGERIVNGRTYQVVRPLRLDRLALTNDPNNKGGKPISNRQPADADPAEKQETKTPMKKLLAALGLAEDASEDSAVAALAQIKNRADSVAALQKERDELVAAQVEADLEKYKGVIKNREAVKKALLANRASALEFLEALNTPAEEKRPDAQRITNRSAAKTPAGNGDGKGASAEPPGAIRNREIRAYQESRNVSFEAAYAAVKSSKPELFQEEEVSA